MNSSVHVQVKNYGSRHAAFSPLSDFLFPQNVRQLNTSFYVCALAIVNGASVNIFATPGVCISNYFFMIDLKVLSMVSAMNI